MADIELTKSDLADIMTTTLETLIKNGITVGVKSVSSTDTRESGIVIFCGGFAVANNKIVEAKQ